MNGLLALAITALVALACYALDVPAAGTARFTAAARPLGARAVVFASGRAARRRVDGGLDLRDRDARAQPFAAARLPRSRGPSGLAIVANNLQDGVRQMAQVRFDASAALESAAVSMPLVLALMAVAGLRAAFLLPISLQANWMFRITDWPQARADRLDAVEQAFVRLAILPALLLSAPVQIGVLGVGGGLTALFLATLACAVLLEFVLIGWRRVPFTCTWLPGKRPLPFALLAIIGVFWLTASAADSVAWAIRHPPRGAVVLSIILLTLAAGLRWRRRRSWAAETLEFEDQPLDAFQKLGLGPS